MKQRDAFEKWARDSGYALLKTGLNQYFYGDTAAAWDAWQAARIITPEMIEAGAQRLVRWDDDSTWSDSWNYIDIAASRNDAERVLRSALSVVGSGDEHWAGTPEQEIETLREMVEQRDAEIEQLRGRVAIMEEFVADAQMDAWRALDPDYVPPAVESAMKSLLHRAATITQEVDPDDIALSAWLLRKQAEAVEETQRRIAMAENIMGMRRAAREYSEELRQQAQAAEKGEGV